MTPLLLVQRPGWQQGALPAPLDREHWLIVLGLLVTKWDSVVVVVVARVVILEVGHCTAWRYRQHGGFSFPSDIHAGVDGCGDRGKEEREPSLDEGWQSGEVGHGYWPCKQKEQQEQTQTWIH